MSEFRKDYLLDRWVIVSKKRGKRPHSKVISEEKLPKFDENCPFCPGNERMMPPVILQNPKGKKWKVRAIENKFPALTLDTPLKETSRKMKNKISGHGRHEVLIDAPEHNKDIESFSSTQLKFWFDALKERFKKMKSKKDIRYVAIFKNHGKEAGASLVHPHTQIVALPTTPFLVLSEMEVAKQYYEFNGSCVFCDIAEMESKEKKRVVIENDHVIAFCSYAPLWPYEVWIVPKEHQASIEMKSVTQKAVLDALKSVLNVYYEMLSDPPYNFYFHLACKTPEEIPMIPKSYHFHIEIGPRLERDAGFEYGSGMNITTVPPEDAAKAMRHHLKG